ncbi:unnamed protein product [Arctogadus glacialis]
MMSKERPKRNIIQKKYPAVVLVSQADRAGGSVVVPSGGSVQHTVGVGEAGLTKIEGERETLDRMAECSAVLARAILCLVGSSCRAQLEL